MKCQTIQGQTPLRIPYDTALPAVEQPAGSVSHRPAHLPGQEGSNRHSASSLAGESDSSRSRFADVMDESLLLIRQVDSEECDSAEIGNYVQSFADRIQMLILQRAILTTTGYTKLVMDLLLEGKLKFFACGAARQLGPCQDESIDQCFKNMEVWVRMALEVLRTEFPHYGIFSAFGAALRLT